MKIVVSFITHDAEYISVFYLTMVAHTVAIKAHSSDLAHIAMALVAVRVRLLRCAVFRRDYLSVARLQPLKVQSSHFAFFHRGASSSFSLDHDGL